MSTVWADASEQVRNCASAPDAAGSSWRALGHPARVCRAWLADRAARADAEAAAVGLVLVEVRRGVRVYRDARFAARLPGAGEWCAPTLYSRPVPIEGWSA